MDGAGLQDLLGSEAGTSQIADGFFFFAQVGVNR